MPNITLQRKPGLGQQYRINGQEVSAEFGLPMAMRQTKRDLFVCVLINGDIFVTDEESQICNLIAVAVAAPEYSVKTDEHAIPGLQKRVTVAIPASHGRNSLESTRAIAEFFKIESFLFDRVHTRS